MGLVISLAAYRKGKEVKIKEVSEHDKFIELARTLNEEWTKHKRFNNLNKFVAGELNEPIDHYTTDLNLLNQIETGIGLRVMLFHPSSTDCQDQGGFIAGYRYKEVMYPTPAMPTEAEARAFNIVLYLRMMTNG